MTDAPQSPSGPIPTKPSGSATTADTAAVATPRSAFGALARRGFDIELLAKLSVEPSARIAGNGRLAIAIPYFKGADAAGNALLVGTKYRTVTGAKQFLQDKGSLQCFYNFNSLTDPSLKNEPIIITEGELDAWAAIQAGYPRTVSVPNGAPLKSVEDGERKYAYLDEVMPILRDGSRIILAVDDDQQGRILRDDLARRIGLSRCYFLRYPLKANDSVERFKDLADVLEHYGVGGIHQTINRALPIPIKGFFSLNEIPEAPDTPAHDTGIIGLDKHYKLRLGDLCVVTGIPGHGKTSFVNEVCCRMAEKGWKTVFCSFEQRTKPEHQRVLRSYRMRKLVIEMGDDERRQADDWINRYFGFVVPDDDDDEQRPTVGWLLETLAQAILRHEFNIVVIDPWNELEHDVPRDMTLTQYVGEAIKRFRRFARKYNIHLIVVAHPAKLARLKGGKYPIPSLYDIADSANWANKPDVGIVVHREEVANNEARILITKVRFAEIGRPGELTALWHDASSRFTITEQAS